MSESQSPLFPHNLDSKHFRNSLMCQGPDIIGMEFSSLQYLPVASDTASLDQRGVDREGAAETLFPLVGTVCQVYIDIASSMNLWRRLAYNSSPSTTPLSCRKWSLQVNSI